PNVGLQFPEPIGLQPISQNMKQQVAGQVRGRSPPERRVPFGSQFLDIEIAQTRDLGVERLSIRHRGIDHHAWHGRSTGATTRGAESGLCTATVDDAIDPLTVDLLRTQFKAELLAHHASEEAANRMLLPTGDAHNGRNRCSLRPAQHGEHASLFRPWPAFARGASFSLRLARAMPRANGRLRCNGSPLARGDNLDCNGAPSVRSGAGLTLVSVEAPTATSLTPIASRPRLVMRSAIGPLPSSRRQIGSEPAAPTSSSRPARMSLS